MYIGRHYSFYFGCGSKYFLQDLKTGNAPRAQEQSKLDCESKAGEKLVGMFWKPATESKAGDGLFMAFSAFAEPTVWPLRQPWPLAQRAAQRLRIQSQLSCFTTTISCSLKDNLTLKPACKILQVHKITGPGNQYVTAAKMMLQADDEAASSFRVRSRKGVRLHKRVPLANCVIMCNRPFKMSVGRQLCPSTCQPAHRSSFVMAPAKLVSRGI